MPQFSVSRNPNPDTKAAFHLLLDVQSDLIADLGTRVVIPLAPATAMMPRIISTLMISASTARAPRSVRVRRPPRALPWPARV